MKLNDTSVRALRLAPGETDKTWFDDNLGGYGVRARKSGAKSYVVQYDFGGKTEKITIGSIELWKEVKARKAAKEVLAAVRLGRNPAAEKRRARAGRKPPRRSRTRRNLRRAVAAVSRAQACPAQAAFFRRSRAPRANTLPAAAQSADRRY